MALRKIQRKTPGGRTVTHLRKKITNKHTCAICNAVLSGTPRGSRVDIRKLNKTQRRPSRPFGGQLCSACSRRVISLRARVRGEEIKIDDVPISLRSYVLGE